MTRLELEADLRFDGPAGPGHITSDEDGVVVRVSGWGRLVRLAWWLWRHRATGALPSSLSAARALARTTHRSVHLDAGYGPRIRIAGPRQPHPR